MAATLKAVHAIAWPRISYLFDFTPAVQMTTAPAALLSRTRRRGRQSDKGAALKYVLRITSKIGMETLCTVGVEGINLRTATMRLER